MTNRCKWAQKEIFHSYHDNEWCKPNYDDTKFFEMLILEGAQAGLSWETILKRRDAYAKAFFNYDVKKCANMSEEYLEECRNNEGIIRNKLKINSVKSNAKVFLAIQKEFTSFSNYIWQFSNNEVVDNSTNKNYEMPASNELSDKVSKDLKKRGMKFVGSVIIYSFLQSCGIINDHMYECDFK